MIIIAKCLCSTALVQVLGVCTVNLLDMSEGCRAECAAARLAGCEVALFRATKCPIIAIGSMRLPLAAVCTALNVWLLTSPGRACLP